MKTATAIPILAVLLAPGCGSSPAANEPPPPRRTADPVAAPGIQAVDVEIRFTPNPIAAEEAGDEPGAEQLAAYDGYSPGLCGHWPTVHAIRVTTELSNGRPGDAIEVELSGSTVLTTDDEGYQHCAVDELRPIATGRASASGNSTLQVEFPTRSDENDSLPCAIEVAVELSRAGKVVTAERAREQLGECGE